MLSVALMTALLAGVAGSAHCFAMCGGMAGALGMRARSSAQSSLGAQASAALYHLGRIAGYAAIGAIGGLFGHSAHWMLNFSQLGAVLRIAAGVLTLLVAIRILWRWNAFAPLERLGAKLWRKLQPLAGRTATNQHWSGILATGLLWGWLPCGLVYSMVLMTFTMHSAWAGAAVMIAFGIGTLPSMLSSSLLASRMPQLQAYPWVRIASGVLMLVFGIWMMAAPLGLVPMGGGHQHQGMH